MPQPRTQQPTRAIVGTVLIIFIVLVVAVAVFDTWYVDAHKLPASQAAPVIAATAGGVSAIAGLVSALFAALSAARTSEASQRLEETTRRATEALSRSMLPDTIDTMIRIEGTNPRYVLFSVDSPTIGWKLTSVVREGSVGPEPAHDLQYAVGAFGWVLPDWVQTNSQMEAWIMRIALNIADVRDVARWAIRQPTGAFTRPGAATDPLDPNLRAPVLIWNVQGQVQRLR